MSTLPPTDDDYVPNRILLILTLTLDGCSVDTIVKYMRQEKVGDPRVMSNPELKRHLLVVHQRIREMPREYADGVETAEQAAGVVDKVVEWCLANNAEGLAKLARSKEFEKLKGDRKQLAAAGRRRRATGIDITAELGYTEKWLVEGDIGFPSARDMFQERLLRYWSTGIVLGPDDGD